MSGIAVGIQVVYYADYSGKHFRSSHSYTYMDTSSMHVTILPTACTLTG